MCPQSTWTRGDIIKLFALVLFFSTVRFQVLKAKSTKSTESVENAESNKSAKSTKSAKTTKSTVLQTKADYSRPWQTKAFWYPRCYQHLRCLYFMRSNLPLEFLQKLPPIFLNEGFPKYLHFLRKKSQKKIPKIENFHNFVKGSDISQKILSTSNSKHIAAFFLSILSSLGHPVETS